MRSKLTLQQHRAIVLRHFPNARCKRDRSDPGPGISYAIYSDDPEKYEPLQLRLTGGWMTPAQAWERAASALNLK